MLDRFSPSQLRQFLDGIAAPVFMVEVQAADRFVYLSANTCFESFTGFDLEHFAGCTVDEMVPAQEAEQLKDHYRRCIEARGRREFEAQIHVPAGLRWWRVHLSPVLDERGEVVRILGTASDVTDERQARETLRYQHLLMYTERELMPDGIMVADVNSQILSWNTRFRDMWGLSDELLRQGREVCFPRVLAQLAEPDAFRQHVERLYRHLEESASAVELQLRDGRVFEWYSRGIIDDAHLGQGRVWYFRDITERKRIERELVQAQSLQQAILDSASQIIMAVDRDIVIRSFNRAAERLLGYRAEEVVGRAQPYLFHDPGEVEERRHAMSRALGRPVDVNELFHGGVRPGESSPQKWHYVRKDGQRIPVELTLTPLVDAQGQHAGFVGVATDISEREAYEQRLHELAATDSLTRLWNRRHFLGMVGQAMHRARRDREPLMVMLLDVDRFKRINDTHGHAAGDAVLQSVAATLSASLRDSDLLCRWGGEEFAAALVNTPQETALQVAERVRAAVEALEVAHGGERLRLSISVGLSDWQPDEAELDRAMQRADQALYQAKNAGRNRAHHCWRHSATSRTP